MDEATANVDLVTDSIIQKTIRTRCVSCAVSFVLLSSRAPCPYRACSFCSFADCTVIVVAHRLNVSPPWSFCLLDTRSSVVLRMQTRTDDHRLRSRDGAGCGQSRRIRRAAPTAAGLFIQLQSTEPQGDLRSIGGCIVHVRGAEPSVAVCAHRERDRARNVARTAPHRRRDGQSSVVLTWARLLTHCVCTRGRMCVSTVHSDGRQACRVRHAGHPHGRASRSAGRRGCRCCLCNLWTCGQRGHERDELQHEHGAVGAAHACVAVRLPCGAAQRSRARRRRHPLRLIPAILPVRHRLCNECAVRASLLVASCAAAIACCSLVCVQRCLHQDIR